VFIKQVQSTKHARYGWLPCEVLLAPFNAMKRAKPTFSLWQKCEWGPALVLKIQPTLTVVRVCKGNSISIELGLGVTSEGQAKASKDKGGSKHFPTLMVHCHWRML
jgi:hypothetical protein